MPHFFIKSEYKSEDIIKIPQGDTHKHLKNALRIKQGEDLLLVDENKIQYETVVREINNNYIHALIIKSYPSKRFIKHNIYVAQGMLKSDAEHFVIQKATELGVRGIYPMISDNVTVKKSVIFQKLPHLQRIAAEAAKQCERPDIPTIFEPVEFSEITENNDLKHKFIFVERDAEMTLKQALGGQECPPYNVISQSNISENDKILLIIGPEGGFSDDEFQKMTEHSIKKITLGNLILRAETAVIAAVANTIHELEN